MTFCRWSDLDYGCDLYVYADVDGGYRTQVAETRVQWTPPKSPYDLKLVTELSPAAYKKVARDYHKALDNAPRRRIGLPYDGKSFWDKEPEAVLERVQMLIEMGYRTPDWLVPLLEEECNPDEVEQDLWGAI